MSKDDLPFLFAPLEQKNSSSEKQGTSEQKFLREMTWWSQGLGWLVYDGLRTGARDSADGTFGLANVKDFNANEFWFNHIGDAYDTTLLMWGTRGVIEVFDHMRQKTGKEEMSPRAKMWTSVLVGMAIPITIETLGLPIGGNTAGPDFPDSFGPLVAGILAGSTWELVNALSDAQNWVKGRMLIEKYGENAEEVGRLVSDLSTKTAEKLGVGAARVDKAFVELSKKIDGFRERVESFDPASKIPSPEDIWKKILGDRIWNALGGISAENNQDEEK